MAIFVTGDTHGFYNAQMKARFMLESINVLAEKLGRDITRGDYMIIAGDVGLIWFNEANDMENAMLDWVESLPWTTLFIDGNHENLTRMRALPETDMFGGKVSVLSEHVIYLRQRGQVYEIDGQKIWCFGGGTSVDKDVNSPKQGLPRVKGISWWAEEEATDEEYIYGIKCLAEHNWNVDYVVTHAAPQEALDMLELPPLQKVFGPHAYEYDHLPAYLQFISQKLLRKHWYFGHYHVDKPDFKVMSSSSSQPEGHQYSALYYKNIQTIERIINFNDVLKAAYNGDPEAMRDLGMMYFMGQGIGKNYAEAVRWSEKAAENGDPDAMFNLCLIYSSDGAAKNSLKAYEWLMKAIDNNNSRALAFIVNSKTMTSL